MSERKKERNFIAKEEHEGKGWDSGGPDSVLASGIDSLGQLALSKSAYTSVSTFLSFCNGESHKFHLTGKIRGFIDCKYCGELKYYAPECNKNADRNKLDMLLTTRESLLLALEYRLSKGSNLSEPESSHLRNEGEKFILLLWN